MKKAIAILLTLVLIVGLSVPAFAAKSPNGQEYHKVVVIQGNDHADSDVAPEKAENVTFNTVNAGKSITVKADPEKGKFDGWKIYKADGTEAVAGVDYKILGVATLASTEMEIVPLNTIVIAANYDNVVTETIIVNDEDEAPETGDSTVAVLGAVALIALCGTVVAKKQLAK
ncbi:MAG: hypothetical protein IJB26_04180 [Clostridia bacterium]|nr:hypothetical protein [Clostridia bacterium]